jgi:hypothetical protein
MVSTGVVKKIVRSALVCHNKRVNKYLILLLLKPSLTSLALTVITGVGLLGAANWTFITSNPFLYEFFFGDGGVVTAFESSPGFEAAEAPPLIYFIGVSIAAIIGGGILFFILRGLHQLFRRLSSGHQETQLEQYRHHVLNQELGARMGFRAGVFVVWVGYTALFLQFFLPFAILMSRIGAEQLDTPEGWIRNVWAFVIVSLCLHLHIIFARLFVMRPRLFGGEAAIEEALS